MSGKQKKNFFKIFDNCKCYLLIIIHISMKSWVLLLKLTSFSSYELPICISFCSTVLFHSEKYCPNNGEITNIKQ